MLWVRKSHGWIGLWGAVLGLLFGFSGIWLNHRAVLKLPPFEQQRINGQLALPEPVPADAQAMGAWLQTALGLGAAANSVRVERARPVAWTDKTESHSPTAAAAPGPARASPLVQPEHWIFNFGGPDSLVQADYWLGNHSVGITTTRNGFIGTLTNMHKGNGMPLAWILLVDTLAGSMILLSLSGVLLWMQSHRRRVVGVTIAASSTALVLGLTLARLLR
jgi:hypothetical protein